MKIEVSTAVDGTAAVYLSEVYSGVRISTKMGVFGIAERDDGIEVTLNERTVWTSHEIAGTPADPEIDWYMARICLCGKPRSEHAYSGRTPGRFVVVGLTSLCECFIDAIERKLGIER